MNTDKGNGFIEIQGIKCYLPPMPDKRQILNYDVKKKEQKWKRTEMPIFRARDVEFWDGSDLKANDIVPWEEAVRQEQIKIYGTDPYDLDRQNNPKKVAGVETDADYSMECLENFRAQELDRFKNGLWIYINGDPYYLTGNYYFYLNYWQLKDGYPEFRYPDLELFYVWDHVKRSKNFLGLVYITMRGVGKSYIAGCIDYYESVTHRKANSTIQSKSDDAAALFFRDNVLVPMSQLPEFLIPTNKHTGDITSLSAIEFTPPSKKGMDKRLYDNLKKKALYSKMQYTNAGQFAADGGTWDILIQDEIGKTDPKKVADVYKRLMVNLYTVWRGNKKLGNIFATSTVEDLKEGGEECLQIWNNSNQYEIGDTGTTNTQMVRYFRSAIDATYFDEYGFPDKEKSKKFHDAKRKALQHDSKAYVGYIQKHPYTEEEAFWINADECVYNAEILLGAKDRITNSPKPLTVRGDLKWKEIDKEVEFEYNNKNGKWFISFLNFEPNMVQINAIGEKKTFTPKAGHKRVAAFDPYVLGTENLADPSKGSKAAISIYNKQDFNAPEDFCDTIIADYVYRHDDPFDSYEDLIIACFFFGCPVLIEKNKTNAFDYFRQRGYKWGMDSNENDFTLLRPESTLTSNTGKPTDGINSNNTTIEHYIQSTQHHLKKHGHKLKHIRVVDAWLKFHPIKRKEHDLAIAASYSIVAAEKVIKSEGKIIDLSTIFNTFDNTGSVSMAN